VPRVYLYISIAFSLIVEILSIVLLTGRRGLVPALFLLCTLAWGAAAYWLRLEGIEIGWAYLYVPIGFGLFVQILNRLAARRSASAA
jgi:hypothetical protein